MFLITAGILIIGIAVYQKVSTIYYQNKLINEYSEYIDTLKKMETGELKAEAENVVYNDTMEPLADETEPDNASEPETIEEKPANKVPDYDKLLKGKTISGIIEIPKINVKSAILEGTDDSALKYAVGHYPGLGNLGEGNYVLLGHRNYVYGHFFRNLDHLKEGDEVIITKDGEEYIYVVYESFVVKPEEVWVLNQTEAPIITMITCTPMGTYTDRLIVRAALKDV